MAEPKRHTDVPERVLVVPTSRATLPNPTKPKMSESFVNSCLFITL